MRNSYLSQFILILIFLIIALSTELTLLDRTTCLQFEVDQTQNPVLFSYHFNPYTDKVNMIIYDKQAKILNETGNEFNYNTFIEIKFNETGLYPICFDKLTPHAAIVQFDIVDEQQKKYTAGKEDINKLSKKISEFLIDIKKVGWEFKQILEQHNKMGSKLLENQDTNYYIFASKMIVMLAILAIQFYAIKYVYQ